MKRNASEISVALFDFLWKEFTQRVPYAKTYAGLVNMQGGKLVFDHIAFRTINTRTGEQPRGIEGISHIFKNLGYKKAGDYFFRKKKLKAVHLEHTTQGLPKIFISQLEVPEFPAWAQQSIKQAVKDTPYLISDRGIELCNRLKKDNYLNEEAAGILIGQIAGFFNRPWKTPQKKVVLRLNDISQYAAWTILHGNSVNHFAASINGQNVTAWPDLETTCFAMENADIPMKSTIEGEKGSKLRQSATLAVKEEVEVIAENGTEKIPWTYAYFEFTQREVDDKNGKLFSGFLGNQARHLFDMTITHDN